LLINTLCKRSNSSAATRYSPARLRLYLSNDDRADSWRLQLEQRKFRFIAIARAINHFASAESRSEVQPFVLRRYFVYRGHTRTADPVDHTRSRRSEQIGMDRFWKSNSRVQAGRRMLTARFPRWLVHVVAKLGTRNERRIPKQPSIVGLPAWRRNWIPRIAVNLSGRKTLPR